MSDRFTSVFHNGRMVGFPADRGRKTRAEMLDYARRYAEHEKAQAEKLLDLLDAHEDELTVETYLGAIVTRKREVVS